MKEVESVHWWYRVRRLFVKQLLTKYGFLPGRRVLEIGCGNGATLEDLQKRGYECEGVEIFDDARMTAMERGVSVTAARAEKLPYPDASFDIVLMLDVLEHIEDDRAALTEARRVLKKDGLIVLFVPAFMSLWGRQDEISQHKRRYTKTTLLQRMPSSFRILRTGYFNFFLFFPIAAVRMITKILRLNEKIPDENAMTGKSMVNAILYAIFRSELPLLKFFTFPLGVSCVLIAKAI